MGLKAGDDLHRTAQRDPVEALLAEALVDAAGHPSQMVVGVLLDAALVVGLGPAALVMLAADPLVEVRLLPKPVDRTSQDAAQAATDQRHQPAALLQDADQRLHVRRAADHHSAGRGPSEL